MSKQNEIDFTHEMGFTVAIIAGGKSSRMGTDKAFVDLSDKPVIEHVLDRVKDLGQLETIVITNRPAEYSHLDLPMYADVVYEKGSLGGIYTAIFHSKTPHTVVVACDMPFVNPTFLKYLLNLCEGFDIVAPRVNGYPEGFHAVYSRACLDPIRRNLDADKLKVSEFYRDVSVRYLDEAEYQAFDPQGLSFFNVNTPEDLQEAHRIMNKNG